MFVIYKIKKELRKHYRRNLKTVFLLLVILCLIIYLGCYFSLRNTAIDTSQLAQIQNDLTVDTSDYMQRFVEYRAIKLNQKQIFDKKFQNFKTVIPNARKDLNKSTYLIYEYTKFFDNTKNCQRTESQVYNKECPFKNCKFTCDSNDFHKSDAVLFHESDMKNELKLDPNYIDKISALHKQNSNQLFILWNDEANKVLDEFDSICFNWTLSYRYDAEVSDCSYGCYHKKTAYDENKLKEFREKMKTEFDMRKNAAIGFITNCKPKYRMQFSADLRKSFKTEIYGRCSSMIYWKMVLNFTYETVFGKIFSGILSVYDLLYSILTTGDCPRDSKCEAELLQNYKFYLSFESKKCHNYITEKFWRILRHNMIPIVIQPEKSFYEKIAPPNSFIHVEDFKNNIKDLSGYLDLISKDFDLYFKHLEWKLDHDVIYSADMVEKRRMCEMCYNLNREDSLIVYKSISNWFNSGCVAE